MNKYFGYSRISTENQSQNSVEEQLEFLQGQAQNLGLPFESIIEKQSTKDISGRKELVNLLSKVQDQDIVGFKYQDRLGRETEEDLILLRELSEKNIRVHVNGQFVDYKDPTQKFTFTTLSAVATLQRELQRVKSLQGIKKKKEKGDWIFTGRIFGYLVSFKGKTPSVTIIRRSYPVWVDMST